MKLEELTVEKVKKMSVDDLLYWGEQFVKMKQAEEIKRVLVDYLEIEGSKKKSKIEVAS